MSQHTPDGRAIVAALGKLTAQVKRVADAKRSDFALTPDTPTEAEQTAAEADEPAFVQAIAAVIRQGPTITVHDDEITIEGLRIASPARLTVHAGRRRLTLRHNAFLGDLSTALDVCRDLLCHCHQAAPVPVLAVPRRPLLDDAEALCAEATAAIARARALADRWDNALAPDKPYARDLRAALDQPKES